MMTPYGKWLSCLALYCACISSAQALPEIQRWTNIHGVPIYFVHTEELPMVDLQIIFTAGSAHDGQMPGLASLTAAMLKKGTDSKNVEQINDALNDLAVSVAIDAGMDSIGVSFRSLSDEATLNESLELLIEIISQPSFPEDEFQHLKRKQLVHIRSQNERPKQVVSRVFREHAYAGHVYSGEIGGTEESVSAMQISDIKRHYRTYFVRANMIVTAVGAVSRQQINTISERISGALQAGSKASAIPEVPPLPDKKTLSIAFPSKQAHVKIGQPFIRAGHPDFFALRLANHILGGSAFGSRLMDEIRVKRGLAYSVYSHFMTREQAGIFAVSFQTRSDQADAAVDLARQIIEDFVKHGPDEEEVALALSNIRGGFALNLGSNSAILSMLGRIARYGLPLDYLDTYLQNFDHLTVDKVHAAVKRHLQPDRILTVVVGDNS